METAIQISSAAATVEGPLEGETGHGLVHLPDANVYALAAGADGRPADNFSVRILSKALRIAFRPKDGMPINSLADKALMIRSAIRAAGDAISTQPSEKRTGGATLAVVAFDPAQPGSALVLNVGDCRCYRFRNSRPECLTRSVSAADTAKETPLLMDVLNNAIGGDEPPEIEEQTVAIEPGDVFVLIPGALFRLKPDLAVGRALRRVPGKGADAMAASLVEEALKTESAAGVALVVKTDGVAVAAKKPVDEPGEPEPEVSVASTEAEPDNPATESVENDAVSKPEAVSEPSSEAPTESPTPAVEKISEPQPEEKPAEPLPVVEKTERVEIAPKEEPPKPARNVRRTPRKAVTDEAATLPVVAPAQAVPAAVPVVENVSEPKREAVSPQAVLAAAASLPPRQNFGPLARKPLLHAEAPNSGKRIRLPLGRIAAGVVVVAILVGVGWGVTKLVQSWRARSANEFHLEEGATATSVLNRARLSGEWGDVEKALKQLPALATGDEDLARAWIAQWNAAAAPEFSDAAARTHLESLGALVTLAGGAPSQPVPAWTPEKRADEYCRIAGERQRALHGAIEASLQALNRRGDIPFADHTIQNATLAGIGRFTKGRHATKLDAITRDFAAARIAEGQLEAVINLRKLDIPLDTASLQRSPGEPLRQINIALDRAWDGLLDVVAASATDAAQWKRTAPASFAPRFNRLDAIRQNVLAERKKFGDVRRWRTSTQGKQLVIALLTETAKLGNELNPPPAVTTPRRR